VREDYLDDINLVIELDSGKRSLVIVLEMLALVVPCGARGTGYSDSGIIPDGFAIVIAMRGIVDEGELLDYHSEGIRETWARAEEGCPTAGRLSFFHLPASLLIMTCQHHSTSFEVIVQIGTKILDHVQ